MGKGMYVWVSCMVCCSRFGFCCGMVRTVYGCDNLCNCIGPVVSCCVFVGVWDSRGSWVVVVFVLVCRVCECWFAHFVGGEWF